MSEKETEELVKFVKAEVKTELETKTNTFLTKEDKIDLIKWMVALWLSAVGLIIRILKFT